MKTEYSDKKRADTVQFQKGNICKGAILNKKNLGKSESGNEKPEKGQFWTRTNCKRSNQKSNNEKKGQFWKGNI